MIVLEGRLLNPASEDVFARGRVVIDGSRIVDAGKCSEVDVPENARVYDVGGTVMPDSSTPTCTIRASGRETT